MQHIANSATIDIPGARFALDLIAFDKSYYNLFRSLLKDTIVCDNETLAKEISYSRNIKAVTVDGVVFHKNRTITGGNAKNYQQYALSQEADMKQQYAGE